MRGGLTRRVVLASAVLVVLISGAFVVLLLALDSMRDSGALARHSRSELAAASRLEKLVVDVETGQRGFVITGDPRFLEPWRAARRAVAATGGLLLSLPDDPGQRRRAARLVRAVRSYIRNYSVPLVAAARRGAPEATSDRTTLRGKRLVDALRARFDRYVATERDILTARQADADSDADKATVLAAVGLVGSILLIVLVASYLGRAIVRPIRRAAAMAGRLAAGELGVRMPATGTGEIRTLEQSFNQMAASLEESQAKLQRYAEEQAALRRVATLVAQTSSPSEVFETVTREVGLLSGADLARMERYESDGTVTGVAAWSRDADERLAVGKRFALEGVSIATLVWERGRPARVDSFVDAAGPIAQEARERGIHSSVGCPIVAEGRLWGVIAASSKREAPFSPDTEAQIAEFTELVATAVANAESRAELAASRARVVAAADQTRRRIERDLHDGTQQQLISLGLELRAAEALASEEPELKDKLSNAIVGLESALEELQEISRGIHPAILSRGGLGPALKALARRSSVPVDLHLDVGGRLPQQVEVATYYVVSEALTNAAKHARASALRVDAETENGVVRLSISDDGVGGANPAAGSGLVGLRDRVEALGGELRVSSTPGEGTALAATIPIPPGE